MNRPFWSRRRPTLSDLNTDFKVETCDGNDPLLSLYADGMAAPEEARRIEAHLVGCADCREALAWMQATHRALASRPLVAPPANLQARIAEAIAASSALPSRLSPARLSPVRKFQLRPAYAAAASLTVLGIVLSVSLLHSPSPPSSVAVPIISPRTAIVPKATYKAPAKHSQTIATQVRLQPRATPRPLVRPQERVAAAVTPTVKISPVPHSKPVLEARLAAAVPPPVVTVPKPTARLANNRPSSTDHQPPALKLPVVTPKVPAAALEAAALEAAVPKTLPTVPVSIAAVTVTTQPETPRTQVADSLKDVREKVTLMRSAGFATIVKSAGRTALNVRRINISDAAVQPMIYTPTDH